MGKNRRRRRTKRKRRMCDSKATYYSVMDALKASVKYGLTWYRCDYCHKWHLTSKRGMKKNETDL